MAHGISKIAPNDPLSAFGRQLADLARQVRELAAAKTLANATIDGGAGAGIRTADFDGASFANPGTTGNYFGADGLVANSLYLRPGSVSNDKLANPISAGYYEGSANGTLTVAGSFLHTGSIPVPSGFTQAIVSCTVTVGGTNSTSVPDNLYAGPTINTANGQTIANSAAVGFAQSVTMSQAAIITNLAAGTSITVKAYGATDTAGWTGGNAHISAQVLFLR